MPKKRYNAEEIIQKLLGADVLLGQGKTVSQAKYYSRPRGARSLRGHCRRG